MNALLNYDIIEDTLFIYTSVGMLFPHGIQVDLNKCMEDTWQCVIGNLEFSIRIESPSPYIPSSSGRSIDTCSSMHALQLSGYLGLTLSLVIKYHALARNTDVRRTII
jgi:hypothetical protein